VFYIPKLNRIQLEALKTMLRLKWINGLHNEVTAMLENGESSAEITLGAVFATDEIAPLMDVVTVWGWMISQTGSDTPCIMSPAVFHAFVELANGVYDHYKNHPDLPEEIQAAMEHVSATQTSIQKAFSDAPAMDEASIRHSAQSGKGFSAGKPALFN
jgi:hypothetical protein